MAIDWIGILILLMMGFFLVVVPAGFAILVVFVFRHRNAKRIEELESENRRLREQRARNVD